MRYLLLLVLALGSTGCFAQNRENRARMWANVWHAAHAVEQGVPAHKVMPSLKEIAVKGAQLEGYVIEGSK